MTGTGVQLWAPPPPPSVPDTLSDPAVIASYALQLREKERHQIAVNLQAGNYELAASFIWMRTMALLKKQLSALGMEFIGELLQRPDIDEFTDIRTAVSDAEAISLARDLGILTPLQTLRLLQSQEIVNHFTGAENDLTDQTEEAMTQEEAISCLRICVQGILGHEKVNVAEDFKSFRTKLETTTLIFDSPELNKLKSSPYFFVKTAISIILSLFKTSKGAQLEHIGRNALLIIPTFWSQLKATEKWQIGQAYAAEFNEGRKESVKGLHSVLLKVGGFDFVPENLRSTTFVQVASSVVAAHQGMNNFYNEPGPMKELASLGTSIPGPALAACMTAVLCVKLGNAYGLSYGAQSYADKVLAGISTDRWQYYMNEKIDQDRIILSKLSSESPLNNWMSLVQPLSIDASLISGKDNKALILATNNGDKAKVRNIASNMMRKSLGLQ